MALKNYKDYDDEGLSFQKKTFLILFVLLYPLLKSMYPILPPLIGLAGYIFITNLDDNKVYAFSALFYLLNLDLNLTLPLLLSLSMISLILIFIYEPLKRLIHCKVCLLFALMAIIDFTYYVSIFIYDFIFNTSTVVGDMLLVYYIIMDIVLGMIL